MTKVQQDDISYSATIMVPCKKGWLVEGSTLGLSDQGKGKCIAKYNLLF